MKAIKRITLIAAAILMFAGSANAKIFNFGVKAGVNVNKLHFSKDALEDLVDKSNSSGWEAGVMVEGNVPIIGIGFDASLMYARMNNGYNNKVGVENNDEIKGKEVVGKNFIMIPINIKYKFNIPAVSSFIKPYVFTGPDFAFNLNKNILKDFKSKTCQVAWNVGLGVELINHLQIGASYGFGMNNVAQKLIGTTEPDVKIKNNYWTVTAAWLF